MRQGERPSAETKKKLSLAQIGPKNHRYGKPAWNRGVSPSASTKKKLSLAKTGPNHPMYGKVCSVASNEKRRKSMLGRPSPMKNRKQSEAAKKMMREHSPHLSGVNHPMYGRTGPKHWNYQGGKSSEEYGPEFNELSKCKIRERDKHTCQVCGRTEDQSRIRHAIHHIDYNKKNNDPMNQIEVCTDTCHPMTNFNRSFWIAYFQDTQKKRELHGWCSALELP